MSNSPPYIIGIGGTPRTYSSSERALRVALAAVEQAGGETVAFVGPSLILPMYGEQPERTLEAKAFVAALRRCDGVIISSPAYHGAISGLVKNALDYIEDLRTDDRSYLDGRAIGCIACAGGWQAAGQTLANLRAVAHALRGWPTPLGAQLNTSQTLFAADGTCIDGAAKFQLETVGRQVVEFARMARRVAAEAPAPV